MVFKCCRLNPQIFYRWIKLAVSGLGCVSVADLFHALRALGRPIGSTLGRQFAQLKKQHEKLQSQLSKANDLTKRQALQAQIETNVVAQQRLEQDQQTYHETLEEISQIIHPFAFDTHHWQLGKVLAAHLVKPLNSLSVLAESYGGDRAQKAIDAFESQISYFAEGIEAWRQWVKAALQAETPNEDIQNWVLMALLPWVY